MHSSRRDLLDALDRIPGTPVAVVGDLILDRYIWGTVERISPEAPVPVVDVRRSEDRLGGAGNTARNLRAVGAKVSLCGFIGDDDEGKILLELCERDGIEKDGIIVDRNRPTSLKTRVIAQAQQLVRIDRESRVVQAVALREGFAAVVESQIEGARAMILSDYGKGAISEPVTRKLAEAAAQGRLSFDRCPLVVDPHPTNYDIYRAVSVAKPNRREAEMASGIKITDRESALKAGHALLKRWQAQMMVITLSEDGLVIVSHEHPDGVFLDTVAREVFDVSGAGDTVTSILSVALASGSSPVVAGDLANIAAGIVVSEVGTAAIDPEKLRSEIERLTPS